MHYKSRLTNAMSLIRSISKLQPTVSNTGEQEKLMSYLAQLTGEEAKILLSHVIHRNIDMRFEGQENDRIMKEVDSNNDYMRKTLHRQNYEIKVMKNDYDMKLHKELKSMARKVKQTVKEFERLETEKKEAEMKADKYKRFYLYCQSNHKEDHHHRDHRSETPKNSRNEKDHEKRVKLKDNKLKIKPSKTFIDSTED